MLGLVLPTDPRWVNIAEKNIREILIDHAYCEQKAASACISLIMLYPENVRLVEMLTPIVAEEWTHFRLERPRSCAFYHDLMISEAGHYKNFIHLAKEYEDACLVEKRWREILTAEGELMKLLQLRDDRLH